MAFKVLLPQPITEAGLNFLREKGYEIVVCEWDEESALQNIVDCDAAVSRATPYTRKVLDAAPKLQVIANYGTGVDNIDVDCATEKGIWVTNTPGANATAVAEHTVYLMLCAARCGYRATTQLHLGNWDVKDEFTSVELFGKTIGIIGLGFIGQLVAKMLQDGFGMKVIGYDPFVDPSKIPESIQVVTNMDEIFIGTDFVSLHIPYSDKNKALVGARELALMKKDAIFINTSRGGNVDEQALIEVLKNRTIYGAGLDVFEVEPMLPDNELLTLDNVFVTPHHASLTAEGRDHMSLGVAKNIHAVLSGEGPLNPLNKITK